MARETWDSRMGEKVKDSHFSAISARVVACPLAAALTARSFFTVKPLPLIGLADSKIVVAAGGDIVSCCISFGQVMLKSTTH
jgi:hypothetical protein